jgi:hypothetical protein
MKNQFNHKHAGAAANALEIKRIPLRAGTKAFGHRFERRKIREQLRRLDWALAGED